MPAEAPRARLAWVAGLAAVGAVTGVVAVAAVVSSPEPTPVAAPVVTVTASAPPPDLPSIEITAPATVANEPLPVISVSPHFDMDQHSLDDPASPWVIINKRRPLDPVTWVPRGLTSVGGPEMTAEAAAALGEMRAAAADAGSPFSVGTAYRSHGFQQGLYGGYVAKWGRERADRFSARPGYSEHQTGLAADIYESSACRLKACFGDEDAGRWVAAHAHEFGFVIRYPEGYEHITGYKYEPWHVRWVGVELAVQMHEDGVATMEEFFDLPPAPDYP